MCSAVLECLIYLLPNLFSLHTFNLITSWSHSPINLHISRNIYWDRKNKGNYKTFLLELQSQNLGYRKYVESLPQFRWSQTKNLYNITIEEARHYYK